LNNNEIFEDIEDDDPKFLLDLECYRIYNLLTGRGWRPLLPDPGTATDSLVYETAMAVNHVMVELNNPVWDPLPLIAAYVKGVRSDNAGEVVGEELLQEAERLLARAEHFRAHMNETEPSDDDAWRRMDLSDAIRTDNIRLTPSSEYGRVSLSYAPHQDVAATQRFPDPSYALQLVESRYGGTVLWQPRRTSPP